MIAATPKNAFDQIKKHVQDNKKYYIIGGVVVGLAAAGTAGYILGTKTAPKEVENLVAPSIRQSGFVWKSPPTLEVHIEALGDPGNIIQDMTTGTIYASQGEAARALGVYPARISEHLTGKLEHVQGHILKNLGKAHVPQLA